MGAMTPTDEDFGWGYHGDIRKWVSKSQGYVGNADGICLTPIAKILTPPLPIANAFVSFIVRMA